MLVQCLWGLIQCTASVWLFGVLRLVGCVVIRIAASSSWSVCVFASSCCGYGVDALRALVVVQVCVVVAATCVVVLAPALVFVATMGVSIVVVASYVVVVVVALVVMRCLRAHGY